MVLVMLFLSRVLFVNTAPSRSKIHTGVNPSIAAIRTLRHLL